MQIQINSDKNIEADEDVAAHVSGMVSMTLNRLSDRITRLEIHLSDQNGDKNGRNDKRCTIEARLEGRQPTAVTHQAATLDEAVDGAAEKLKRSIDSVLGRVQAHR